MLTTLLVLTAAVQEPEINCDDAMTQFELNTCTYRAYERADAAMNAQWKITSRRMKQNDANIDRRHDNRAGYFDTLLAAQRAWLTYRDKHCANEGYAMRGGSAEPMVINGCLAQLTAARTKQLQELIEEY
ncbi:MAG: lysozyme inhibitor LprI family protein [Sphingopyxis sp.]|uniref:lysozyme inhibitor LprI family protein n=1 Tax=Sphingopyxis sp. TaxID=1908224 RepID=UPI002ABC8D8C|nr:lysozyme inhibitor LprI family protein [Sphingopyxis sp.]MDZ3831141.1 lysozyme inhibitor LprI family protein [Sphingopyxis sp.]